MAMNRGQIERSIAEAETFIAHAQLVLIRLDAEAANRGTYDDEKQAWVEAPRKPAASDKSWGSKETGTLRRKSMDLTRILADLRRP